MPRHRHHLLIAQPIDPAGLKQVGHLLPDAHITCRDPIPPDSSLPDHEIRDCTILFADHCPSNVANMPALRWIQLGSAGYQQLAGLPLGPAVRVSNASGVNDIPIAEWCLLMMLSFTREFPAMLGNQRRHSWSRERVYQAELRGRRVGIFGYGSIGREVARLSQRLGLEVWALSRNGFNRRGEHYPVRSTVDETPARFFPPDRLREFLEELDFLVITAALNQETVGRFGATELGWLPRRAVVLNPARAWIIDESALVNALRDGRIAGAALDSHYREPMPDDDVFWHLPNTIITPHISGSTGSTHFTIRLWDLFLRNLDRFLSDTPLLNEIPPHEIAHAWTPGADGSTVATMAAEWTIADAWVFSAIEGTGPDDGYTLAQIIAKADAINHAMLTEAEFTQAVPRLVAAGLIGAQAEADRYWHTEAGRALFRKRMKRRGLFGWMDAIPPALGRLGEPQDTVWSLPAGVFDRAIREYHKRFSRAVKRLHARPKDPTDTP